MKFSFALGAALSAIATTSSALTLNVPSSLIIGKPTQITWTNGPNDRKPWILFLMNPADIWGLYSIISPIEYDDQVLSWTIPSNLTPGRNYVLRAVNASNVDMVFTSSPIFVLTM